MSLAWAYAAIDNGGEGYGAVQLEELHTKRVCADLEARDPGLLRQISAALSAQREAEANIAALRRRVQAVMPGEAVNVAFAACKGLLGK